MRNNWSIGIYLVLTLLIPFFYGCKGDSSTAAQADLILFNGFVYPVKSAPIPNGAIVIQDGKIIAIGPTGDILKTWGDMTKDTLNCHGAFVMPGLIEGHGHFSGLGFNLLQLDLLSTSSWEEIVDSVRIRAEKAKPGEWIVGRGWHQEKWNTPPTQTVNGYPYHDMMSLVSPENPVMLFHASGHALFANQKAMDAAGISLESGDPNGGRIVRDHAGTALGVFEENAMDLIWKAYSDEQARLNKTADTEEWHAAIQKVQEHCLGYGITSFQDAGADFEEIARYKSMAEHDSLDMRLWCMVKTSNQALEANINLLPIMRAGNDKFTCRSIKGYMDGALGSFGAWLLEPYADKPGFTGQNTTPVSSIDTLAQIAITHDLQLCVHAIGDRGNREVLNVYENAFKAHPDKKDLRWRIEHAQHLHPDDMPRFKNLGVIASMQGIHCTSDAPFVVKRLGEERASQGAYAWRRLLDYGVIIANGTDAPVERVDPFANIYASVTRKRLDTGQEFYTEQSMTREEALYAYTLGNAYAAFEEDIKGSLEPGKWADIAILSNNLLNCNPDSIPKTKVLYTIVGGKVIYMNAN